MTRSLVLLDADGVLADFVGAFLGVVARELGRYRTAAEVTSFGIANSLGLSKEDFDICAKEVERPGFCASLSLYPGAQDGVRALREVADIHVVTSPWNSNRTWCSDREAWLYEHFGIHSADVTHTAAKHLMRGDFLVDDKTSTLVKWQAAHPDKTAVQWVTPHNRLDGWTGASTCDWARLVEIVRGTGECHCNDRPHRPFCPARSAT